MPKKRTDKPSKITLGSVTVRPVRPRGKRGPHDGRWYWRACTYRTVRGEDGKAKSVEDTLLTLWATREEAEQAVIAELAKKPGAAEDAARSSGYGAETLKDILELWTGRQKQRLDLPEGARNRIKPNTYRLYKNAAKAVKAKLGHVRVAEANRLLVSIVERYVLDEHAAGTSATEIRYRVMTLRRAWVWSSKKNLGPSRPFPDQREIDALPDEVEPERYRPPEKDMDAVLKHLRGWPRMQAIILRATGCRVGELAEVRWKDVDLDRATLVFDEKTGRRVVPIDDATVEALRAWRPEDPDPEARVLGVARKTIRHTFNSRHLKKACEKAKVKRFTPHGYRRARVDVLRRAGIDPLTASALMGHSVVVMMQMYGEASDHDMRQAVARVSALQNPGKGKKGEVVPFPDSATG